MVMASQNYFRKILLCTQKLNYAGKNAFQTYEFYFSILIIPFDRPLYKIFYLTWVEDIQFYCFYYRFTYAEIVRRTIHPETELSQTRCQS